MSQARRFQDLFILSPPNSGTTAMAKLLLSSPMVWSASPIAEGQKLPGAAGLIPKRPWKSAANYDWPAIKALWEAGRPPGRILLEKSPPNLVRAAEVLRTWPEAFFVISIRNPYAVIASRLGMSSGADEVVPAAARVWIDRSRLQRANIDLLEGRSLVTTYEDFTAAPGLLIERLEAVFGPLGVAPDQAVQVKRYPQALIASHNDRQISTLSPAQLAEARAILEGEGAEELAFWGY